MRTIYFTACLFMVHSFANAQNLEWAKHLSASNTYQLMASALAPNGDLLSTGAFGGTVDFDPGDGVFEMTAAGSRDQFVLRTDANGNFVWAMAFGSFTSAEALEVACDDDNNFYVAGVFGGSFDADPNAGTTMLTAAGPQSIFVAKYNANRELQWANKIDNTGFVRITSLVVDGNGGAYIAGAFNISLSINDVEDVTGLDNTYRGFLVKFDAGTGAFEWAGYHSGNAYINGMTLSNEGQLITVGEFFASCDVDFDESAATTLQGNANRDVFIAVYNPDRSLANSLSFGASGFDAAYHVAVDTEGNIVVAGAYRTQINPDPAGSGQWQLSTAGASNGCFIVKYTDDLEFIWAKQLGKASDTFILALAIDAANHIYTTGEFDGSANMDPASPETNQMITASGDLDGFLNHLDADGNYVSSGQFSGPGYEENPASIIMANDGTMYISGHFNTTLDVDPGNDVLEFTSPIGYDSFITKYSGLPVSSPATSEIDKLELFPNPTAGAFTLRSADDLSQASIQIYNLQGQLIPYSVQRSAAQLNLELSVPAGLYQLVISDGNGAFVSKKVLITGR